jgi:hypothetical protein
MAMDRGSLRSVQVVDSRRATDRRRVAMRRKVSLRSKRRRATAPRRKAMVRPRRVMVPRLNKGTARLLAHRAAIKTPGKHRRRDPCTRPTRDRSLRTQAHTHPLLARPARSRWDRRLRR